MSFIKLSVLPKESLAEYFLHLSVLSLEMTVSGSSDMAHSSRAAWF